MSEELMQFDPVPVGRYRYLATRGSTLAQLKTAGHLSRPFPRTLSAKKPDGLILDADGNPKAVIEYKLPQNLKTKKQVADAINQEIGVAKALCSVLIVTDNTKSIWINTATGNRICDELGSEINTVVNVKAFSTNKYTNEARSKFEALLDSIESSVSAENDQISAPQLLDPTPLARALWQKIWVNTGKDPEKCLYNVVELFVFKFLSDLGVLKNHLRFEAIYVLRQESPDIALRQYAAVVRPEIRDLFPPGDDGTTVINGTIFVNEKGEPNFAQAHLYGEVLDELHRFSAKHGSFRHIQKEFKTRLYESFLRQSAGVKALGQFFTPRTVVQAMVRMSSASSLKPDARICDPFCGVGGFLLETLSEVPSMMAQFTPTNGVVRPSVFLRGYDKGSDEKDDERTIILAKANMLIYFSDLIAENHTAKALKELSKNGFNSVFKLLRSNLGTFERVDEEQYDLILTNPPYVTSGFATLRRSIDSQGLGDHYTVGGRGTESISMEWIVKHLAPGGQALVVVPDGLLQQSVVLQHLMDQCIIQAIVSLPDRTFYSTRKKTYILAISRKVVINDRQTGPVFTYLVSEIGESRDSYRFPIDANDLAEAVSLFNQFKGSPLGFTSRSKRCKVVPFSKVKSAKHWLCERWWSIAERKKLGIETGSDVIDIEEFSEIAKGAEKVLHDIGKLKKSDVPVSGAKTKTLRLGGPWMKYVQTKTGWNKTKYRQIDSGDSEDKAVYSAARQPVAFVKQEMPGLILAAAESPVLSFASNGDGSAGKNFVLHETPFYVSTDRTCLKIVNPNIDPRYVLLALNGMKEDYGFNHTFKAIPDNLLMVSFEVPTKNGKPDLVEQKRRAEIHYAVEMAKADIEERLKALTSARLIFS